MTIYFYYFYLISQKSRIYKKMLCRIDTRQWPQLKVKKHGRVLLQSTYPPSLLRTNSLVRKDYWIKSKGNFGSKQSWEISWVEPTISKTLFHFLGILKLPRYNPQPGHSLENSILIHRARDGSSESEYFSCTSSFYNLSYTGKDKGEPLNSRQSREVRVAKV